MLRSGQKCVSSYCRLFNGFEYWNSQKDYRSCPTKKTSVSAASCRKATAPVISVSIVNMALPMVPRYVLQLSHL